MLTADEGKLYIYRSGSWSMGSSIGPAGPGGRSIEHIAKTSSEGLTDHYTITYSDGKTDSFLLAHSERPWNGYRSGAMVKGNNGALYLGEMDRISHLFMYYPPVE